MDIDAKATLSAQGEIEIAAPPDRVWSELTAIERWSEWQPGVASSRLEGGLAAGGGTRVVTRESMSGWLPRLLKLFAPGFLSKSLALSLRARKARAEGSIGNGA